MSSDMPQGGIDARGRADIAELVVAAMGWSGLSGPKISKTGRVGLSTVNRVKRLEPVGETMLRALGDVLDLPRDFLLYVGRHDVENVIRAGARDMDLLRWTIDLLAREGDLGVRQLSPQAREVLRTLGEHQ